MSYCYLAHSTMNSSYHISLNRTEANILEHILGLPKYSYCSNVSDELVSDTLNRPSYKDFLAQGVKVFKDHLAEFQTEFGEVLTYETQLLSTPKLRDAQIEETLIYIFADSAVAFSNEYRCADVSRALQTMRDFRNGNLTALEFQ